jgi:hypothetical protein
VFWKEHAGEASVGRTTSPLKDALSPKSIGGKER